MSAARSLTCLSLFAACFLAACPGPQPNPITLPGDSLGDTTVGVPYSHTIAASGGTGTLTYAATGLPAGLLMDSNTGKISGTATAAGDFSIAVTVTDSSSGSASKPYPFKVYPAVSLVTASFPDAVVSSPYSQTIQTDGGKAPIALTLTSSDLPPGMTINSAGALAGTPSATGTFTFTVQARDANGATTTRSYTLTIIESLRIVTTTLPPGNVGVGYSQVIQATGGRAPISFTLTSGALPPGLTLAATGVISGTPTGGGGTFSFRVSAQDGGGAIVSANLSLTILGTMPPRIITASLPDAVVGRAYNVTLQGADGAPPYTWAVATGSLPSGMSLSASGVLSGTPSAGGSFPLQVSLTDANNQVATKALTLLVIAELRITTPSLSDAYTGTVFSTTLGVTGGRTPYSWSVTSGALPSGITLSSGGILTGTPSAAGAFGFVVTVTDGSGQSANQALSITVYDPPSLVNTVLADASTTSAYNELLTATGGKSPYTFAVTAGALPPGLTLATTGAITGTPTMASGTPYNFAVTVTDANGRTGSRNYSILVSAGLVVTTGSLPDGYTGSSYSVNLAAVGGRTPYTWSLASGTLPAGLALSSAGVISGTPTVAATRTFDVRVTDSTSPTPQTATKTLTIAVFSAPSITTTSLSDGYVGSAYSVNIAGT
ncbi:MAG TPA: putative Ig domain-containing protein, partial [Nonomuraea sp.]|nr:putative Ig domain-containing protein [Nonomuraea sp.]